MTISASIRDHLSKKGVAYDLVNHPHSQFSLETAKLAKIPASQVTKSVLTHDGFSYLLCVIPSNHQLVIPWLNERMRGDFHLVREDDLDLVFPDCELGAVPALGQVYGLHVIWDESLTELPDLYIESGDHENLIHVTQGAFMELMGGQEHMVIRCPDDAIVAS